MTSHAQVNYMHGLFSQSFEVKAVPGSILILESPSPFVQGLVGGKATFQCKAEAISFTGEGKPDPQYQW